MSWLELAVKAATAIGSLATFGSVLSATDVIKSSGLPEYAKSRLIPTQSTSDVIKAAETQATYTQKMTGIDNVQNPTNVGLPAKTGTDPIDSRVAAALAALGIGGAAAAGTAIGIQRLRGRRILGGRRRRRRHARRGYVPFRRPRFRRRRYGGFRRRRGFGGRRHFGRRGGRRF